MNKTQDTNELQSEIIDGNKKFFCVVRKSFVPATPEEEVRQYFLKYLIYQKNFPVNKLRVEESLAHYGKGNRRVDILALDENDFPLIIYECKKPFEPLTDEILDQIQDYYDKLETVVFLGLVIGDNYRFIGRDKETNEPIYYAEHPNYFTLVNGGEVSTIEPENFEYVRNNWRNPIDKKTVKELVDYGIIGNGTDEKYHSFLINFDGWILDQDDKLDLNKNIEDIGIKVTKFGSAGGGFFPNNYRSFLVKEKKDKPIICIALSAIRSSNNVDFGTCIYVGIETTKNKNSSLELRIGKSLKIENNKILIHHNGTITIGKLGAAKKQDLMNFIEERKPNLIKNGLVFLGEFDENTEINSTNVGGFIENLIEYALLRNEFRDKQKKLSNLNNQN